MPLEDALDGCGGEVLPVDPQPVEVPAAEVEEVVLVAVGEIPGPVPPVADPGLFCLGVAPVPLESGPSGLADHLSDGRFGVEQAAVLVERRPRALLAGVGVEDQGAGKRTAERPPGSVGCALDCCTPFGRSVGVLHRAAEPLDEPCHVGLGRLVSECPAQRVDGIVGELGGGQDVRERLPDIVEVGHPVAPDVDEELRGAEPLAQGDGGSGGQGGRPTGHQRIGVEERHGQVADVVAGQLEHLGHDRADAGQSPLAAQAGLGGPRRPRGEEQQAQGVLGDRRLRLVGERRAGDAGQEGPVGCRRSRPQVSRGFVDDQDPLWWQRRAQAVPLDQRCVARVGHQQLALGMGEVPGQFVTPVGRIAPDEGGTGQRGPAHPEHVLGDVVEEERDVERPGLPQ